MGRTGAAVSTERWGLDAIEAVVNRLLGLDPEVRAQLVEFEGKQVALHLEPGDRRYLVGFEGESVALCAQPRDPPSEGEPDVVISGSPLALLALLARVDGDATTLDDVAVSGDIELVEALQKLARRFRFDWEEQLSRVVGDVGAHEISRYARSTWHWGRCALDSLIQDTAEYLVEEARMVPDRAAAQAFIDDVDELRDAVERLALRVERLARAATEAQG